MCTVYVPPTEYRTLFAFIVPWHRVTWNTLTLLLKVDCNSNFKLPSLQKWMYPWHLNLQVTLHAKMDVPLTSQSSSNPPCKNGCTLDISIFKLPSLQKWMYPWHLNLIKNMEDYVVFITRKVFRAENLRMVDIENNAWFSLFNNIETNLNSWKVYEIQTIRVAYMKSIN